MDKRILLLITDLDIGGTPTVVRELALRLDRHHGTWVEVACLDHWGPVADQLRDRGITVKSLNARGRADISAFFRLLALIKQQRIDIVFSFLLHSNAAAAVVSPFCGKTRFLQSIQTTQPEPAWHWKVQRAIHRAADKIVVPSPSAAQVAQSWAGIPPQKIVVIPNAVDPAEFSDIRRKPGGGKRVGFIGRLDPIKRVGDLVEAIARLDPDVTLDIFGQGTEHAAIEAAIERLHLRQRVHLQGAVPGPRDALRAIDLLVLPSQAEGFGLVLIEAMAAGVPVIGADVAGIRDVIVNGGNGLLVPAGSPVQLAAAIQKIFSDPGVAATLVAGGLATVNDRFTWQRILPQYLSLLGVE